MPVNTTNMALPKPIDSDNAEAALASSIPTAFDKIDAHRHTGGTDGLQIGTTAIPTGASLTSPSITTPTITAPTIPNNSGVLVKDVGGTSRLAFIVSAINDYWMQMIDAAAHWKVVNFAGTTDLLSMDNSGNLSALGTLKANGYIAVVNDSGTPALLLTGTGTSSGAGSASVTFSHAFSNTPIVVATPQTGTVGLIGVTIMSVSTTGFTFQCNDSSNVLVNGKTIDFIAFGAR